MTLRDDEDRYFDLEQLVMYTGLSLKTLRRYMADPINPLPSHHVHSSTDERGRVLIAKREVDAWIAQFPSKPKAAKADLDASVAEAVASIRGGRR